MKHSLITLTIGMFVGFAPLLGGLGQAQVMPKPIRQAAATKMAQRPIGQMEDPNLSEEGPTPLTEQEQEAYIKQMGLGNVDKMTDTPSIESEVSDKMGSESSEEM